MELIKKEMVKKVNEITYENLMSKHQELNQFVNYLEVTNMLPISMQETEEVVDKEYSNDKELEVLSYEENPRTQEENDEAEKEETIYLFERKVRGGVVVGLEGGYVIPERMVRDMGVQHGDKLKIKSIKEGEIKNSYWFDIVEKGSGDNPERRELKYCKVKRDMGEHVISEYEKGNIRIDEIPFTFIINESDVNTFKIEEGDIIDVAYYKNNPTASLRVLYKHDTEEEIPLTSEQKRLNFTINKKTEDINKIEIEKEFVINPQLFKNRKVLVVGGGSRKKDYLNAFSKFGALLEHATGDEDKTRITSMVTKADVVAISIGECSHDASQYTIRECKKFNKPFSWTDRNGIQSILMCAEEAIKRGEEKVS